MIRATSVPAASTIAKFQARQFSAWIAPTSWPPATRSKRILPNTLACTISPTGAAVGPGHQHPRLHDLRRPGQHQHRAAGVAHLEPVGEELVEAGDEAHRLLQRCSARPRRRRRSAGPGRRTPRTRWSARSAWSSGSPRRTGWSYSDGPAPAAAPACWTGGLRRRRLRATAAERRPGRARSSAWPSHQRVPPLPAGSGYQPGGGGGCVTAVKLAPTCPSARSCVRARLRAMRRARPPPRRGCWPRWTRRGWSTGCAALIAVPSVAAPRPRARRSTWSPTGSSELGCDVDRWPIDLAEAATAPDAPGQEVDRTEAWGVVGTRGRRRGRRARRWSSSGHTDVVPPGDPPQWAGDPFVPRLTGGALHGRGACDMKAGVVASLGALAAVRTAGVRLGPAARAPRRRRRGGRRPRRVGHARAAGTAATPASSPSPPPEPS